MKMDKRVDKNYNNKCKGFSLKYACRKDYEYMLEGNIVEHTIDPYFKKEFWRYENIHTIKTFEKDCNKIFLNNHFSIPIRKVSMIKDIKL